jgi:hypothetical protein
MGEKIFDWLFALNIIAGFWFVYSIIEIQFRRWRKRRLRTAIACSLVSHISTSFLSLPLWGTH